MELPRLLQFYNEDDFKILTKKLPKCKTPEDYKTASDLKNIMFELCRNNRGIGLSSNQIGVQLKFFVLYTNKIQELYINPKLISGRGKKMSNEGCLSWDNGQKTDVNRFTEIDIEYEDEKGNVYTGTLGGINAIVYQHELDHMKGRVI